MKNCTQFETCTKPLKFFKQLEVYSKDNKRMMSQNKYFWRKWPNISSFLLAVHIFSYSSSLMKDFPQSGIANQLILVSRVYVPSLGLCSTYCISAPTAQTPVSLIFRTLPVLNAKLVPLPRTCKSTTLLRFLISKPHSNLFLYLLL